MLLAGECEFSLFFAESRGVPSLDLVKNTLQLGSVGSRVASCVEEEVPLRRGPKVQEEDLRTVDGGKTKTTRGKRRKADVVCWAWQQPIGPRFRRFLLLVSGMSWFFCLHP